MPLTDSLAEVSLYLEALMNTNKEPLGVADVFYGDQDRIPRTPTICVEPGEKRRSLNGAPRRTQVDIILYIIVYHSEVRDVRTSRKENDQLAEAVEATVHADAQMGGRVIDSLVSSVESGYQMKKNTIFRASRLTVEARSQMQLPSSV